jgi:hypothetical protein
MAEAVFVDKVPKVEIIDDLVRVKSAGTDYVMLPAVFRKHLEQGQARIDAWEEAQPK